MKPAGLFALPGMFCASLAPRLPKPPVEWCPADVSMDFGPSTSLLEVFERAENPDDPIELRDLYLGRVESRLNHRSTHPGRGESWRATRSRRVVTVEEVLTSSATVRFVKEMFNHYFRNDLYGDLRREDHIILSSGSVDERDWGMPVIAKECIAYALARDWYGYSDSRGREPARAAVAACESIRVPGFAYAADNVALTLGGTFAAGCVSDLALTGSRSLAPSLCAIPNYPPLLEAIVRRGQITLVPTPLRKGVTSLEPLLEQLRPDTPLILLQTVTNPTGAPVAEDELARLIRATNPNTLVVLDECHEWLGTHKPVSIARTASNVVRINSLSKSCSAPGAKLGWILADKAFIDGFYDYASATYGGPPSLFYTAIEVLARMERWRLEGLREIGFQQLAEFEDSYGLTVVRLQSAFTRYVDELELRERSLTQMRDYASAMLDLPNTTVVAARYSINSGVVLHDCDDSYLEFRRLLAEEAVSVFPGLLTFCLNEELIRVTTSRRFDEMELALQRVRSYLGRRQRHGLANGFVPRRSASPAASNPAIT